MAVVAQHVTSHGHIYLSETTSKKQPTWQAHASNTPLCHSLYVHSSAISQLFLLGVRSGRRFRVGCVPRRGCRTTWRSGCVRGLMGALGLHHVRRICQQERRGSHRDRQTGEEDVVVSAGVAGVAGVLFSPPSLTHV
jgi:hypothetical protein